MKALRALVLLICSASPLSAAGADCVVLLHGLVRTAGSMETMAEALREDGYHVVNIDYPSRHYPIRELSDRAVADGLRGCAEQGDNRPHFVTHSLGGILVRHFYARHPRRRPRRVVMLGPPNDGTALVDELSHLPGFELLNGPAGHQLGTGPDSVPADLPVVDFQLGVIAGTRSINPILSAFLPNPDDGRVSVAATRVEGMTACIALPVTHTFMMNDGEVIRQTRHFLRHGRFADSGIQTCAEAIAAEQ